MTLLLIACAAPDVTAPIDDASVVAEISPAIATVAVVTYAPADAPDVYVELEDGRRFPGSGGRAVLAGLTADTAWDFRFVSGEWVGATHSVTTGPLPAELPEVTLVDDGAPPAAYIATSWVLNADTGSGVYVLDAEGHVVWYDLWEGVGVTPVVRKVPGGFLYLRTSHGYLPESRAVFVSTDGLTRREFPLPLAHHDLVLVPDAAFAVLVGEVREVDGENVVGDTIVEVAEDGSQRVVWSPFDHLEVTRNDGWNAPVAYPEGADWLHTNGLFYDAVDDAYYASSYNLRAVMKIARGTGALEWILGGPDSDFALADDAGFGPQHAPRWVDGELLMFDNGYTVGASRLVQYGLDATSGVATRTWEWRHPDDLYAIVLGDVDALGAGRHLSAWSTHGEILVTTADGTIEWRVDVEPTFIVAQVEPFDAF
jgi:hypothetical protein